MLSFWEHKDFTHYDYVVVGSGITGLSTACCLKETNAKASVLVLEKGLLPTGASTKNAGFACIGSLSEKVYDLGLMGVSQLLQLVEDRWKGLALLRKRLGDAKIGYQNNGGYELIMKTHEANYHDQLKEMNVLLAQIFGKDVFREDASLVQKFGFSREYVKSVICNPFEGQLDTGRMMSALYQYASSLGIKIITGASVRSMESINNKVELQLEQPIPEGLMFYGDKVAVCTNAFTKKLFPALEITPGRGQVICTTPISNLKFKGTFSFDDGFYYFRDYEQRVIFGGGRNLDFERENTLDFEYNEFILKHLEKHLHELILPGQSFRIEYRWTGIMAFGAEKLPILQKMNDQIFVGARLNGMGIALGSMIAQKLAGMMMD